MEKLLYILLYFVETIKFIFGYEFIINKKIDRKWMFAAACVPYAIIVLCVPDSWEFNFTIVIYAEMLFLMIIFGGGRVIENFKHVVILEIFLNAIDGIVEIVAELVGKEIPETISANLASNIMKMFLVLFAFEVRKYIEFKRGGQFKKSKSATYFAAVLLSVIVLETCVLHLVEPYVKNHRLQQLVPIVILLSYFCIIVLALIVMYTERINNELSKQMSAEQELFQMKENYYGILLEKEEQTRKYRHDLLNHYVVLQKLQAEGKYLEAESYFADLITDLQLIQKKNIQIGNPIIEILANYYLAQVPQNIEIKVNGFLSKQIDATDKQICTVFGNLLQNAVEAVSTLKKGKIKMTFEQGKQFVRITISNSVEKALEMGEDELFLTSKQDTKNHGFGIQNVKEVLSEIGGQLNIRCENQNFIAEVVMNLLNV